MVNEGIAQSATVDRTKLLSQSYANIYNLINTRSNIADPKGASKRTFVYTREPHVQGRGFSSELFPFIVLKKPMIDFSEFSVSETKSRVVGELVCEVYSSDEMSGYHKNKGNAYFNQIVDDLFETINNVTNKTTLRAYAEGGININTDDMDDITFNNKTIFFGRFTISFDLRMVVSA
jgi:hypothetical protein|tara:strand:+ start:19560 stop:20090 length:531 start_codon:yes stop_codon:yes gene_type:complete